MHPATLPHPDRRALLILFAAQHFSALHLTPGPGVRIRFAPGESRANSQPRTIRTSSAACSILLGQLQGRVGVNRMKAEPPRWRGCKSAPFSTVSPRLQAIPTCRRSSSATASSFSSLEGVSSAIKIPLPHSAAVQAIYDTLKALRECVPQRQLRTSPRRT